MPIFLNVFHIFLFRNVFLNKLFDNTAMRVSYQGNIEVYDDNKCNRCFFKLNGKEYSGPLPIDSVLYIDWSGGTSQILRSHSFEGF